MLRRLAKSLAVIALLFVGVGSAVAIPLVPSATVVPPLQAGALSAGVVQNTINGIFGTGLSLGTYTAEVLKEGAGTTSPFGVGTMTFAYQFTTSAGAEIGIGRVTAHAFDSFLTDVVIDVTNLQSGLPPATKVPNDATRDASGNVVGFDFSVGVNPGERSFTMVIRTNATAFTTGIFSFFDQLNGIDNQSAFAPAAVASGPVPAPSAALTFLLGAPVLAFALRRSARQIA